MKVARSGEIIHPYAIIPLSPAWFRGNDVIPFYGQVLITNQQNSR